MHHRAQKSPNGPAHTPMPSQIRAKRESGPHRGPESPTTGWPRPTMAEEEKKSPAAFGVRSGPIGPPFSRRRRTFAYLKGSVSSPLRRLRPHSLSPSGPVHKGAPATTERSEGGAGIDIRYIGSPAPRSTTPERSPSGSRSRSPEGSRGSARPSQRVHSITREQFNAAQKTAEKGPRRGRH